IDGLPHAELRQTVPRLLLSLIVLRRRYLGSPRDKRGDPIVIVTEKLHRPAFSKIASDAPQFAANFSHTSSRGHGRRHNDHRTGGAMREIFESEIPDTAPYKEWLGIVGSMLVAVLICAVLFAGGVLT